MLGGNNENPLPQDSQFQYQTNTSLNQLHLLGTSKFLDFLLLGMSLQLYHRAKAFFPFVCGYSESWLHY